MNLKSFQHFFIPPCNEQFVHTMAFAALTILSLACGQALAGFDIGFEDDSDLTHFVSRPEIRAPLFNVSIYEPEKISPGYWMLAPYVYIDQQTHADRYYQPYVSRPVRDEFC